MIMVPHISIPMLVLTRTFMKCWLAMHHNKYHHWLVMIGVFSFFAIVDWEFKHLLIRQESSLKVISKIIALSIGCFVFAIRQIEYCLAWSSSCLSSEKLCYYVIGIHPSGISNSLSPFMKTGWSLVWITSSMPLVHQSVCLLINGFLVSEETVVLRQWESETKM